MLQSSNNQTVYQSSIIVVIYGTCRPGLIDCLYLYLSSVSVSSYYSIYDVYNPSTSRWFEYVFSLQICVQFSV